MNQRVLFLCVWLGGVLFAPGRAMAQKPALTRQQYQQDFDYFWNTIQTDYSYFAQKQTD